jgi:large subunit ribosomal protein L14e
MMNIGRLCVKIAGRDAGKKCVIIEILEGNLVMIDGETRRRKCNIKHLQPLTQELSVNEKASHEDIVEAFKTIGIELKSTTPKQKTEKPAKQKKAKVVEATKDDKKSKKKADKKAKDDAKTAEKAAKKAAKEEKKAKK